MTGIEWWCRVVFHAELNASGDALACNFGGDSKPEINTRGYATCGKQVGASSATGYPVAERPAYLRYKIDYPAIVLSLAVTGYDRPNERTRVITPLGGVTAPLSIGDPPPVLRSSSA